MCEKRSVFGYWPVLLHKGVMANSTSVFKSTARLLTIVQVLSRGELFLAPHVSPILEVSLRSRGVQEQLQQFSNAWSPPLNADQWRCRTLSICGLGWRHTAADIVIPGLGFLAVTGSGEMDVEVCSPCDVDIYTRPSWIETTPPTVKWT